MIPDIRTRNRSHTRKGPGRMPHSKTPNPAGTKLVKRFIRDASNEATAYRRTYAAMTGQQYHERYSK